MKEEGIFSEAELPAFKKFVQKKAFHLDKNGNTKIMTLCLEKFLQKFKKRRVLTQKEKELKHYPEQLKYLKQILTTPFKTLRHHVLMAHVKAHPQLKEEVPPDLVNMIEKLEKGDFQAFSNFMISLLCDKREWIQKFNLLKQEQEHANKLELKQFLTLLGAYLVDFGYIFNLRTNIENILESRNNPLLSRSVVSAVLEAAGKPAITKFLIPSKMADELWDIYVSCQMATIIQSIDAQLLEKQINQQMWAEVNGIFKGDKIAFRDFTLNSVEHPEYTMAKLERLSKDPEHQKRDELKKFLNLWGDYLLGLGVLHELGKKRSATSSITMRVPLEVCNAFFTAGGRERLFLRFPDPTKLL